jgi:hypothetical protein
LGRKRQRTALFEIDNSIEVNYFGKELIEQNNIKGNEKVPLDHQPNIIKNKLMEDSVINISDENSHNNTDNDENDKNNDKKYSKSENSKNEEEAKYDNMENDDNEFNMKNINNENNTIFKLLEKCAFKYLYEKIKSKSFSENNALDKEIIKIINDKGYSNVKSSLFFLKNNNFSNISTNDNNPMNNSLNNIKTEEEKNSEKKVNDKNPQEYHYNIINNFYYRYKFLCAKKKLQKYICCADECNGQAELDLEEKKFNIIKKHTISPKNHPTFNEDKSIKFMKRRKLEEIHIKQNENNELFHMEWFKK